MKILLSLLLILSIFTCLQIQANPGATSSLDISVVDQAKEVYFNYLLNILKNVKIGDINFKGGYIHDNSFFITESSQNVQIGTDSQNNGITLYISDLGAGFTSKQFRYKISFITAKGTVEVSMKNVQIQCTISVTTQTLANGKIVPAFTVQAVNVNIPKDGIKIKITGNVVAQIADAFKSLFLGTIRDQIQNELKDILKSQLPPVLNKLMADQLGYTEIYKGISLDWSLENSPKITDIALEFGIKGLIFNTNQGEIEPSVIPPVMPMHDEDQKSQFQVFISNYLADSLCSSYLNQNVVHFWTYSKDVPSSFPIQLNTTSLNFFFPGLVDYYGVGVPIDIEYKLNSIENFTMRENDQTLSFNSDLAMKFWVETGVDNKEVAVDIIAKGIVLNFTVLISQGYILQMDVKQIQLQQIQVISTTFGDLNMTLLSQLLNKIFNVTIPFLNKYLENVTVQIPTELFGLFKLSDLVLKYHDNYLEAGLTPTFVPITQNIPGVYEIFKTNYPAPLQDPLAIQVEIIDENDQIQVHTRSDQGMIQFFLNQYLLNSKETFIS